MMANRSLLQGEDGGDGRLGGGLERGERVG